MRRTSIPLNTNLWYNFPIDKTLENPFNSSPVITAIMTNINDYFNSLLTLSTSS
jgi:hypothetical protein